MISGLRQQSLCRMASKQAREFSQQVSRIRARNKFPVPSHIA